MSNSCFISTLPAIAALDAKIDIIDTVADAIQVKTDATPQNVRGTLNVNMETSATTDWVDVFNITGHGVFMSCFFRCYNAADTLELRITIDGVLANLLTHTGDIVDWGILYCDDKTSNITVNFDKYALVAGTPNLLNIEFSSNFRIEIRRSLGAGSNVACKAVVCIDPF